MIPKHSHRYKTTWNKLTVCLSGICLVQCFAYLLVGSGTVLSSSSGYGWTPSLLFSSLCLRVHMILQPLKIKWNWKTNARQTHTPPVLRFEWNGWNKKKNLLLAHTFITWQFFSLFSMFPCFFVHLLASVIFAYRFSAFLLPFSMLCKGFFFSLYILLLRFSENPTTGDRQHEYILADEHQRVIWFGTFQRNVRSRAHTHRSTNTSNEHYLFSIRLLAMLCCLCEGIYIKIHRYSFCNGEMETYVCVCALSTVQCCWSKYFSVLFVSV